MEKETRVSTPIEASVICYGGGKKVFSRQSRNTDKLGQVAKHRKKGKKKSRWNRKEQLEQKGTI